MLRNSNNSQQEAHAAVSGIADRTFCLYMTNGIARPYRPSDQHAEDDYPMRM